MRTYQFHSELSSDEVWFRMNQLLMDYTAWGPEGYQVAGELTAWGCYLRLTRAGGRSGMRVPLWLWTEAAEDGCDIRCRFLPSKDALRMMTAEPIAIALWVFCVFLQSGNPVLQALISGLMIGGAFALFMVLAVWLMPRLSSRRRERQLLRWIADYVVPRSPENILLPDTETQREGWEGLRADREIKVRHVFHAPVPPEQMRETLERWRQEENSRVGPQAQLALTWKDWRVTISRRNYRTAKDAVPFRGRLESDGTGGSVLRGGFRPSPLRLGLWTAAILLCLGMLVSFVVARTPHPTASLLLVYIVRGGIQSLLLCENEGSREILNFMRIYFTEIEE